MSKLPVNKIKRATKVAYSVLPSYMKLYNKQKFPSFAQLSAEQKEHFFAIGTALYSRDFMHNLPVEGVVEGLFKPGVFDNSSEAEKLFLDTFNSLLPL